MLTPRENRTLVMPALAFLVVSLLIQPIAFSEEKPQSISGKQVFEQKCLKCHKPDKFKAQHHDRQAWEQILTRMGLNTCNLTDTEAVVVADYLVKMHGE